MDPVRQYAPNPNVVERLSLNFLRGRIDREQSHIHRWSQCELAQIKRIERSAIGLAALAGAVSGGILGGVEMGLDRWLLGGVEAMSGGQLLTYWSIYIGLAVLISGAEVLYLYWNVLREVARISSIAGLRLSSADIEEVMARGLSRAALELPNPQAPVYGIDPYVRVPRWRLLTYTLLYRLKIGATSFILRVLLRRVLARSALRVFIPLIGIPVYAVWNSVITRWVMRESRIRAACPLVAQELGEWIAAERTYLNEESRWLILRGVGEAIIRSEDAHPNFVLLLARLFRELDIPPHSLQIDWQSDRIRLKELDPRAQNVLLSSLTLAVMIDGRVRKAEKDFLQEAHVRCGRSFRAEALSELQGEFFNGQGISEKYMRAVGARSEDQPFTQTPV